ncbi:Y-family DNA polymerase [[Mycoplasma] anseris]|uniref:DNA polymerase IV n=1 Tax=[Mycoplasma] anseris TaxID=92400 RepID=A0A2Z4NDU1_9BACT|nr:DNA polymerase IV [[Mycoplasma] anseris]AWX69687.1 DNA polymerase IV [[Mycoplasma] anseris]
MNKTILHLDMDTFFVSCERKVNPNLVNKPVAIGKTHYRGIATALSNELKQKGLKAGDPVFKVKAVEPNTIFVDSHYDLYSSVSNEIFEFLKNNYTKKIDIYSIDECFIDASEIINQYQSPMALAKKIQNDIKIKFNLPCSIGISFSKFLAKMSTNLAKPHGIKETRITDIKTNFYDLPIEKVFGIGKANSKKLKDAKIFSYKDLIDYPNELFLRRVFGKNYKIFISQLKGSPKEIEIVQNNMKGYGNSITFDFGRTNEKPIILKFLKDLSETVIQRTKAHNVEGNIITVSLRTTEKIWIHKTKKYASNFNDIQSFFEASLAIFEEFWDASPIIGLGLRISNVNSIFKQQGSFDLFELQNPNSSNSIINKIKQKNLDFELKTLGQLKKENSNEGKSIKFVHNNLNSKTKIKI